MTQRRASKAEVTAARLAFEAQNAILRVHERQWNAEWDEAPTPFIAVAQYFSPEARAAREVILAPWRAARDYYESVKPKQRDSDED